MKLAILQTKCCKKSKQKIAQMSVEFSLKFSIKHDNLKAEHDTLDILLSNETKLERNHTNGIF
jgi:hypothetical protein